MNRYRNRLKYLPAVYGLTALTMIPSPAAWGQEEAAAPRERSRIDEVIVTARKTEESEQAVPLSIVALSADKLEQKAVLDVVDLQTNVPGLLVAVNSQGNAPTFAIRAAKADNGTSDTVTAYIDDVPVASTLSVANMMYDMDSVSTLKGPQGTLFGANSTGGAIIFRPKRPTDEFESYVEVGGGRWNRREGGAMINVPLSEALQFRLAGEIVRQDGYVDNEGTASSVDELSDDEHESARLSVRFAPNDAFENMFSLDYFNEDDQQRQETTVALRDRYLYTTFLGGLQVPVDYALAGVSPAERDRVDIGPLPTWNKHKIWTAINAATYQFSENTSFKAVVGYQDIDLDTFQDNDGTIFSGVNGRTTHDIQQWTFEPSIDITRGRFHNKTGLFYQHREQNTGNSYRVIGLPWDFTPFGGPNSFVAGLVNSFYPIQSNSYYQRDTESYAIYTQFGYELTDTLTATVGARYTKDKGDYVAENRLAFGTASLPLAGDFHAGNCAAGLAGYDNFDPVACTGEQDLDSGAGSFTVTLENRFSPDAMIYAAVRGGYIAGGFNNQAYSPSATGIPQVFDPEKVVDFEMGFKTDWELGGRPIRTNLAAFYGNYRDQQRVQNGTTAEGTTFIGVVNAGSSTFYGADLEVVYQVADPLELAFSWNHIESEYTNFDAIVNIPGVFAFVDLQGKEMSQTPNDVVNASATFRWPFNSVGDISSTVSYFWRSKTPSQDSPTAAGTTDASGELISVDPAQDFREYNELKSFGLLNFTTQWSNIMGSKASVNVYVQNVTDKKYVLYTSNQMLQYGYATYMYGTPRSWGVNLRYDF